MLKEQCTDAVQRQRDMTATYPSPGRPRWYDKAELPLGVALDAHGTPYLEDAWVLGGMEPDAIAAAVGFVHKAALRYRARFVKFDQVYDLIAEANMVCGSINQ